MQRDVFFMVGWIAAGLVAAALEGGFRKSPLRMLSVLPFFVWGWIAAAGLGADLLHHTLAPELREEIGLLLVGTVCAATVAAESAGPPAFFAALGAVGATLSFGFLDTNPLLFGAGIGCGMTALGLMWLLSNPTATTLRMVRVIGLGTAALFGVSILLPVGAAANPVKSALVAWCYTVAAACFLGLVPVATWTRSAIQSVGRPSAYAWIAIGAPSALLAIEGAVQTLPLPTQETFISSMTIPGILAIVLNVAMLRSGVTARSRYLRTVAIDAGIAAVGISTGTAQGWTGALVILLLHLLVAPAAMNDEARIWPRRISWAAASGIPPSLGFWGRWLVFGGTLGVNPISSVAVAIAAVCIGVNAVLEIRSMRDAEKGSPGAFFSGLLAGAGLLASAAPAALIALVLGTNLWNVVGRQ